MQYEEILNKRWDVVIVGGGPGGMGAALYTARADLSTLIIEKQFVGGLIALTHEVENYPAVDFASGMELTQKMEAQVKKFGTEILYKDVQKVERVPDSHDFFLNLSDGKQIRARSLVIACGSAPRRLPAAGEEEYYGRGVSYCATCDGAFFRDKDIVVVGGGESAFQEGLFLTQFGKSVTLVHRRDAFRATELAKRRARSKPNWTEKTNYTVEEIYGNGTVNGVKLKHTETGEVEDFRADGVFGFIGYEPASHFAAHLIDTDEEGYIVVDGHMRTTCKGIWAAGDIIKGSLKQMVISAGNGATAAIDIREYLSEEED
ncbi:MAG: thioredoxin-disulfide reductase [Planctomycetales bacterium]|nr:thioredoxin-disulfide reductase [bacterium]UNM09229.1 MAG: thioredoxin-disulfide reductase [Planctomycetales bacterium]